MVRGRISFLAGALAALAGCRTYEAKPLVSAEVVERVDAARRAAVLPAGEAADFGRAAKLLSEHGPSLKEARAKYGTAMALAGVDTPWPNPSIEVGPSYGFGAEVDSRHFAPFGALGVVIPLSGRLARQDEANAARAGEARVELVAQHREAYVELRRLYGRLALARARRASVIELAGLSAKAVASARRLVAAGEATALDVGLLELEEARGRVAALGVEDGIATAEGDLAALTGVRAEAFAVIPDGSLPVLPAELPDEASVRELFAANHAGLGRLRAAYEVAEADLHLEITKQYPDLRIGATLAGDPGEQKYVAGLSLGIDIPLFDRNQQAIEQALARREEIRERYEAEAARGLARLETALRRIRIAADRLTLLRSQVLEKAGAQVALVRRAVDAGSADVSQLLESERSYRQVVSDVLDVEVEVRDAWSDLEAAVGCPLVLFPGEDESLRPKGLHEEEGR